MHRSLNGAKKSSIRIKKVYESNRVNLGCFFVLLSFGGGEPVLSKKQRDNVKTQLTPKQRKFADIYIKTGNATQSAIEAGYKKKNARFVGAQNLTKLNIKEYIDAGMQKLESKKIMGAKEALQLLTTIARGEGHTKQLMKYRDQTWFEDVPPSFRDRLDAAKEILKRYPTSELERAQIKRAQAEAVRAEAEADVAKAQAQRLHTVADKTAQKMDQLSTEDLRKLASMVGGDDNNGDQS